MEINNMVEYDLIKSKNGRVYILVEKSNNPNIIQVKDITPEDKSDYDSAFEIHPGFHCSYLLRYHIYEEDQTSLSQFDRVSDMYGDECFLSSTVLVSHNINTGELDVTIRKNNMGVEHIVRPYHHDDSYISKVIITVRDRSYNYDNDVFINFLIVTKEMEQYLKVVKYGNSILLHDDGEVLLDPESLVVLSLYKKDDLEEL